MNYMLILFSVLILLSCNNDSQDKESSDKVSEIELTEIKTLLDSIYVEDQELRKKIDGIMNEFGWESDEMKNIWSIINKKDSSNIIEVERILDKYGWLSSNEIGYKANSTLFLVVQHSTQEVQEKYLPMMKRAVKDGNASARQLALLEDRVALGKGELQVYGSQITKDSKTGEMHVAPLFEPENVNERRAKVGLGPIEDYISSWNLVWDVEEYKKKLPYLIKKMNR